MLSRPADSYEPVSIFDGYCSVEPLLIRTTLFPCSRPWASPCLDNRTRDRGASSRGPRFMYGCSRCVRWLGYPLLIPSTVAPEPLFERFALKYRLFLLVDFPWGRASDPRGGSPRTLGGVFDSFEGYVALSDGSALIVHRRRGARGFDPLASRRGCDVLPVERAPPAPD